jgi:hypothetical protein
LNGTATLTFTNAIASVADITLSMWLRPDAADHTFSVGGSNLDFSTTGQTFSFGGVTINRKADANHWTHIGVVASSSTNGTLYVDGEGSAYTGANIAVGALSTANFDGLIDEVRIYSKAMNEGEVRLLGGRLFLDLSGNKYHASSVGPDFNMSSPGTGGSSSARPGAGPANDLPGYLGDSKANENHGHSVYWDDNDSYLDLSTHLPDYAGLNQGSISFWVRTSGWDASNSKSVDLTVFSASDSDDNQSFFRIMVRDIGVMQLHVANDGVDIAKFYTNSANKITYGSGTPTANDWHHVVLVVDESQSTFWIDGSTAQTLEYADGAGARRAFFSDVENLDFMAIGKHITVENNSTVTNGYSGWIDDFYMYDRALTQAEISFLYELKKGREQIPLLESVVDAIGTINMANSGLGYKETPEVVFSYGADANTTSQLIDYNASSTPEHGTLAYDQNNSIVYVYHDSPFFDSDWRIFQQGYGLAELNSTSVEHILWTKDTGTNHILALPSDRNVTRRYIEYITEEVGRLQSPNANFSTPNGLFGYQAPPQFQIETAPVGNSHASGFALFFLDKNKSAEIIDGGMGLDQTSFDDSIVRISGKGFRPSQSKTVTNTDFMGNPTDQNITTNFKNDWHRLTSNDELTYNSELAGTQGSTPLAELTEDTNFTLAGGKVTFQDWTQNAGAGEPRIVSLDFNQTVSHVSIENPGFGYSVPVEINLIGGKMRAEDYFLYMESVQTNAATFYQPLPPQFREA